MADHRVTIAAFVAAIYLLRFVPQQFFPASDRPELVVDLTLRQNASIYASEDVAKRLEAVLAKDKDIDHWSTYVGRGAIRFYLPLNVQLANPFFAQVVIVAKDLEERKRVHERLEKLLAEEFPDVVARISPLELGPPVGWPVQYRVSGPDKDEVRKIAQRARADHRGQSARAARQLRLDGAGAPAARQDRPGPGAADRRQLGGHRCGPERRDHRLDGDTGARRHLPDRRGRACRRQGARVAWRRCARCRCRSRAGAPCR